MKQIDIRGFSFHDFTISDIEYDGNVLTLYMPNAHYNGLCRDLMLEMQVEEHDVSIYHIKQYPRFHKVRLKGKEISASALKSFFKKGYTIEIVEFMISADSALVVLECVLFPYSPKAGVFNKIILKIHCEYDHLVLKEKNEA